MVLRTSFTATSHVRNSSKIGVQLFSAVAISMSSKKKLALPSSEIESLASGLMIALLPYAELGLRFFSVFLPSLYGVLRCFSSRRVRSYIHFACLVLCPLESTVNHSFGLLALAYCCLFHVGRTPTPSLLRCSCVSVPNVTCIRANPAVKFHSSQYVLFYMQWPHTLLLKFNYHILYSMLMEN